MRDILLFSLCMSIGFHHVFILTKDWLLSIYRPGRACDKIQQYNKKIISKIKNK